MITTQLLLLLLLLLGLRTYTCLKLPAYMKPCSRNDPNINECAKQRATAAIPHLINGDKKYKIPQLDPLFIEELSVQQGSSNFGLSLTARNLTITGLKTAQVKDIRIDLKKQHIEFDLYFTAVDVRCLYNVTGQVLILPISGSGNGQLIFEGVDGNITFDFDKVRKGPQETEYLSMKNLLLNVESQHMSIHLENLFNGNKFLGDNMNTFLNENWRELLRELTPPVSEAITQVVLRTVSTINELVPYDEYYPEKV